MTRLKISVLYIILLGVFLPVRVVLADIGPKPSMEFDFELPDGVTIISGKLYECDQDDCSDAAPIEEVGPQGIRCDQTHCSATAYGFATYHWIEIQFSDGTTRQSNIFETIDFDSVYRVTINGDELTVEGVSGSAAPPYEDFPAPSNTNPYIFYALGCICVLLLIGLITFAILFFVRRSKKK